MVEFTCSKSEPGTSCLGKLFTIDSIYLIDMGLLKYFTSYMSLSEYVFQGNVPLGLGKSGAIEPFTLFLYYVFIVYGFWNHFKGSLIWILSLFLLVGLSKRLLGLGAFQRTSFDSINFPYWLTVFNFFDFFWF